MSILVSVSASKKLNIVAGFEAKMSNTAFATYQDPSITLRDLTCD